MLVLFKVSVGGGSGNGRLDRDGGVTAPGSTESLAVVVVGSGDGVGRPLLLAGGGVEKCFPPMTGSFSSFEHDERLGFESTKMSASNGDTEDNLGVMLDAEDDASSADDDGLRLRPVNQEYGPNDRPGA